MSGSLNKVQLIGNLGKDPEIRETTSGVKCANFSMATSESWTDKNTGQKTSKTEWHRIVMWRGLAEIAEKWLKKGATIYVEGKLTTRSWDDQNGQKRYSTEIVVDNMQMLGGKQQGDQSHQGQEPPPVQGQQGSTPVAAPEDDLPF